MINGVVIVKLGIKVDGGTIAVTKFISTNNHLTIAIMVIYFSLR